MPAHGGPVCNKRSAQKIGADTCLGEPWWKYTDSGEIAKGWRSQPELAPFVLSPLGGSVGRTGPIKSMDWEAVRDSQARFSSSTAWACPLIGRPFVARPQVPPTRGRTPQPNESRRLSHLSATRSFTGECGQYREIVHDSGDLWSYQIRTERPSDPRPTHLLSIAGVQSGRTLS